MTVQPAAFPAAKGPLEPAILPGVTNKAPWCSTTDAEPGGIRQSFASLVAQPQDPISDKTLSNVKPEPLRKKAALNTCLQGTRQKHSTAKPCMPAGRLLSSQKAERGT